ncbi:hypothetical protein AOC36_06380 [Erysipelothrix larvae]|uniref:VWFA domain-containing protein n=1 Tax=Erysipelothrix larvae TaxID=1514105 RepID=A0A0X8H042_9FIRM|nr:VWA domain-containing protein [Erysipelothrix larvae]AMC93625.1 hypothetical protein AOC36_06380 [Erysipelothrix larvae]
MEQKHTELVFIIDKSGSMGGLESDTLGGYNAMLHDQLEGEGECILTTLLFNHTHELIHDRQNIKTVKPLTLFDYQVGGSTALIDAIGWSIDKIMNVTKNTKAAFQSDNVVFVIITDGYENSSSQYTSDDIKRRIEIQKKEFGWEFIFLGANIDAVQTAKHYGIPANRAQNYNVDCEGIQLNYKAISHALKTVRSKQMIMEDWNQVIQEDYTKRNAKR